MIKQPLRIDANIGVHILRTGSHAGSLPTPLAVLIVRQSVYIEQVVQAQHVGQVHIVRAHLAAKSAFVIKVVPHAHELGLAAH